MDAVSEDGQRPRGDILAGGGEMGVLMRSLDWTSTPIGPVERWPQSLRTAVSICLNSRFPILIWWGCDLVMLYNDAYRQVLGTKKHPGAMGQRGQECWPEIWNIIGPMLEGVLTAGEATWSDDQMLPLERSGYVEECYFTFSYSPIRDETGGVGGVFTAVTETTDRVVGERRLRLLRELAAGTGDARTVEDVCDIASRLLAAAPDDIPFFILYLLDESGQIARPVGASGMNAESSKDIVDLSSPSLPWPLSTVAETGEPVVAATRQRQSGTAGTIPDQALVLPIAQAGQDGIAGFLVAGISPRRALDDDYRGFFSLVAHQIAASITDARAYEDEHRRSEALAELNRAKTTFFSNISHEFRTPLTLLLGPIEDALTDSEVQPSPVQRERLEIAHRNGLRLLKLVNTLLDVSRLEADRTRAHYQPTDLSQLTAELASAFRSAIERAGLKLEVHCEPLSAPVYVDRDMWEKIVLNLLSNALKFTFEGEVVVTMQQKGQHVELEVRDTGIGVAEEELPHLFERFHQVRDARSRTHEGTGIGLYLVQELVRLHGGDVSVHSKEAKGTIFTAFIPLGKDHLASDQISVETSPVLSAEGFAPFVEEALRWFPDMGSGVDTGVEEATWHGEQTSWDGRRLARVLVVDDNSDMREYLTRLLQGRYDVRTEADGLAALETVREEAPDLILTDIMMPRLDGLGMLAALRKDPRTAPIPVILLSARAGEEAAVEGLEAGADDYVAKPFTARELIARVQTHLQLARTRRQVERQKASFFAAAAHDLKTPLTSIKGFAQLLRRQVTRGDVLDSTQLLNGLERINTSATRMMRLIDELLDVTRPQGAGPADLSLRSIDLVRLAGKVVAETRTASGRDTIVLKTSLAALEGRWDEDRLERVLGNLLANAVKYSPDDSAIEVTIGLGENDHSEAIVTVRDRGMGIPTEDLPHVLDPFFRGSNVPGDSHGTGIGLAGVKQIVEQHGGTIEIESRLGKATTVVVHLPLARGNDETMPSAYGHRDSMTTPGHRP